MDEKSEDSKIEIIAKVAAEAAAKAVSISTAHQEVIINKIDVLTQSFRDLDVCFDKFKLGIGQRLQKVEDHVGNPKDSLAVLENKVETVMWVLRGIATPILGAIGLSILGFLAWHFMKAR